MDFPLQKQFKITPEAMQKFMQSRVLLYCAVLLLCLKIASIGVSINFPNNIFFADITKTALENFVNEARHSLGLNPLKENSELSKAAQLKAQDMVQNQYFQHTSPTGVTPWFWLTKVGYTYKYAGENLAVGFFESNEVYQAWLDSPSHKANLLNPNYREIGTAVLPGFGNNNAIIVVQLFGTEQPPKIVEKISEPIKTSSTTPPATEPIEVIPEAPAEKVLSETTELKATISPDQNINGNNLYLKFINSAVYNSEGFLQTVIFGLSLVIIGILALMIFFSLSSPVPGALVLRSLILIAILSASLLINREVIVSIIPHTITI